REVRNGIWKREENRGIEIEGKTVGLIGYGNMGGAFAQRLKGFDCEVIFHNILPELNDENARLISLEEPQHKADIISLHTPQTPETFHLIDQQFIDNCRKSFWLINTAIGKSVNTVDLVNGLKSGKILGAGLDELVYEKSYFENVFADYELPEAFQYLINADNVLLSTHIAGWTVESKEKLAQTIVNKIVAHFK